MSLRLSGESGTIRCLARCMPVATAACDVVLGKHVLGTSASRKAIVAESKRVLRTGGAAVVTELAASGEIPHWLEGNKSLLKAGINTKMTTSVYLELFSLCGFANVEVTDRDVLTSAQLEHLFELQALDLEIAGCSASGAIFGSEVAALLDGQVERVAIRAER